MEVVLPPMSALAILIIAQVGRTQGHDFHLPGRELFPCLVGENDLASRYGLWRLDRAHE